MKRIESCPSIVDSVSFFDNDADIADTFHADLTPLPASPSRSGIQLHPVPEHNELATGAEAGKPVGAVAPAPAPSATRKEGRKDNGKSLTAEERKQRRLESNRLAAKRAYYRRLDKVAAMQQENKTLQDKCEEQRNRLNVYEILLRRLGVDPAAAYNAAQAQQKGRRATSGSQAQPGQGPRAAKQQKQQQQKQQRQRPQSTLTEQMSRLTTAGAPIPGGLAGTPPSNLGGSNPNSPSGQFGALPAYMELEGSDLDGLPAMSLSGDMPPGSPPHAQIKAEQARIARRQQQQQRQQQPPQPQGGGGTVEGMPYMSAGTSAPGAPFGTTSTEMFLSASALEGTLSDPQAFAADAATSASGMFTMPTGADLNTDGSFAYNAAPSHDTMGQIVGGGLDSATYSSVGAPAPTLMQPSDPVNDSIFAGLDDNLGTSTARLGGVADGL